MLKHASLSFLDAYNVIGVNYLNGSISLDRQVINTSKYIVKIKIKLGIPENSLNLQNKINQSNNYNSIYKYTNNGSFFLC